MDEPQLCEKCNGTGILYFENDCKGCSGIVSPAHEPSCGIEQCECQFDPIDLDSVEKFRDHHCVCVGDWVCPVHLMIEELRATRALLARFLTPAVGLPGLDAERWPDVLKDGLALPHE